MKTERWARFQDDLREILNRHSIDNELNMHDFVAAEMVTKNLRDLSVANTQERELQKDSPIADLSKNRFDL